MILVHIAHPECQKLPPPHASHAGRDEDIQNVDEMFNALMMNIPTSSIIFSGLRGVGKTVLINKLQTKAEDKGIFCKLLSEGIRYYF